MNKVNKCERLCALGDFFFIQVAGQAFRLEIFLFFSQVRVCLGGQFSICLPLSPFIQRKVCGKEEHFRLSGKARISSFQANFWAFRQDALAFILISHPIAEVGVGEGRA